MDRLIGQGYLRMLPKALPALALLAALALAGPPAAFAAGPPEITNFETHGLDTTTVLLEGTVDPNGLPTTAHFEYAPLGVTSGSVTPAESIGDADPVVLRSEVKASVNALFWARLVAENSLGTTTTHWAGAAPIDPLFAEAWLITPVGHTDRTATLRGALMPHRGIAGWRWHFRYRKLGDAAWIETPSQSARPDDVSPVYPEAQITGLEPKTEYEYYLFASNSERSLASRYGLGTFMTSEGPVTAASSAPLSLVPQASAADHRPPAVSGLLVSPSAFRPTRSGATIARFAPGAARGARVEFDVDESSTVLFRVLARVRGRWAAAGSAAFGRTSGHVIKRLSGRVHGGALIPGRYRLEVVAVDGSANRSRPAVTTFRIAPP